MRRKGTENGVTKRDGKEKDKIENVRRDGKYVLDGKEKGRKRLENSLNKILKTEHGTEDDSFHHILSESPI